MAYRPSSKTKSQLFDSRHLFTTDAVAFRRSLDTSEQGGFPQCLASSRHFHRDSSPVEFFEAEYEVVGTGIDAYHSFSLTEEQRQITTDSCIQAEGAAYVFDQVSVHCFIKKTSGSLQSPNITYTNDVLCVSDQPICTELPHQFCEDYEEWISDYWESEFQKNYDELVVCDHSSIGCARYEGEGRALGTGAIVGISAGTCAFVGILLCFTLWFVRRRRQSRKEEEEARQAFFTGNENFGDDDDDDDSLAPEVTLDLSLIAVPGTFETHNKTNEESAIAASAQKASSIKSKKSYGPLRAWVRDRHFKHTCLYLANIVFVSFWIHHSRVGCPQRRFGGCEFDSAGYFWIELKPLVAFIWVLLYLAFLAEFWWSSTYKYLRNMNTTQSLRDYMDKLYRTPPSLSISIECYHYETRYVTYTDSNGHTQTRTETYPVVTFSDTELVHIVSWVDMSPRLSAGDISSFKATKVVVTNEFSADDNYTEQRSSFISRNQHRDLFYNFRVNYKVEGYKDRLLCYVNSKNKPAMLNLAWCCIFHMTIVFALPFRLWMGSVSTKVQTGVYKSLKTTRVPELADNSGVTGAKTLQDKDAPSDGRKKKSFNPSDKSSQRNRIEGGCPPC